MNAINILSTRRSRSNSIGLLTCAHPCSQTYQLKLIQNEVWKKQEVRVWMLIWSPTILELLSRIYLAAFFLPSCNLPLNLINKDEFLSIMKFTLNHKFFSVATMKGQAIKGLFIYLFVHFIQKNEAALWVLRCQTWACGTTVLLKSAITFALINPQTLCVQRIKSANQAGRV